MERKISIIGGDLRIVKLVQMLAEEGKVVKCFALEKAEVLGKYENVKMCNTIKEAIEKTDIIVGPIPLSSNSEEINTQFSSEKILVKTLFENIENQIFVAGRFTKEIIELAEQNKVKYIDLLEREELAVLNAISTAEGTIQIAMEETARTIHGSKVLVMGFGRIGKIISKMLDGIGASVYCEARKNADLAWIKAYGYNKVHLNELNENLSKFDIIINTIPKMILTEERLKLINSQCLLIDIASTPGGIDRDKAKSLGLKTIWALSLPGKVAPHTSAEFIKETLYNIIGEMN